MKLAKTLVFLSLLITANIQKTFAQDKVAMFMNNGQPIASISCGNFDRLEVKFPLPDKPGATYDRIKFVLNLGDEEFKSRNYLKTEIYYYLSGKPEIKYIVLKDDSTDFTGASNEKLDFKRLCNTDPNKPVASYTIKAEAKGYTVDKMDKKNHPVYKEPEVFVKGEITVQTVSPTNK